jgi:hypothetical protein
MYSYIIITNCAAISYNMIQGSLPISWAIDPQLGEEFPVRNSPPQLLTCPDLTWPGLDWTGLDLPANYTFTTASVCIDA